MKTSSTRTTAIVLDMTNAIPYPFIAGNKRNFFKHYWSNFLIKIFQLGKFRGTVWLFHTRFEILSAFFVLEIFETFTVLQYFFMEKSTLRTQQTTALTVFSTYRAQGVFLCTVP